MVYPNHVQKSVTLIENGTTVGNTEVLYRMMDSLTIRISNKLLTMVLAARPGCRWAEINNCSR